MYQFDLLLAVLPLPRNLEHVMLTMFVSMALSLIMLPHFALEVFKPHFRASLSRVVLVKHLPAVSNDMLHHL